MSDPPPDARRDDAPERNVFFLACQNDELFRSTYDLSTWQLLGEGSSGCVVRILSRVRREYVAVKILERVDEETHRKIADEVRVADRITSDSVVRVHGPLMSPNLFWLEMEYVPGRSLRAELDRVQAQGGRLPLLEALELSRSITRGVAAIHGAGVVHRDLKPHNIILPTAGQPRSKITDFGISRFWDQERATLTTEFRGTPQYTAPELLRSRKEGEKRTPVRPESDIYSLGMVLYEALTGRVPYNVPESADAGQWSAAHLGAAPIPARHVNPELPAPVADMLMAMLSKQPEQRPRLAEVLETLDRCVTPVSTAPARKDVSRRATYLAVGTGSTPPSPSWTATASWPASTSPAARRAAPARSTTSSTRPRRPGAPMRGFTFFHRQDTEHAVAGEGLYLSYGCGRPGRHRHGRDRPRGGRRARPARPVTGLERQAGAPHPLPLVWRRRR